MQNYNNKLRNELETIFFNDYLKNKTSGHITSLRKQFVTITNLQVVALDTILKAQRKNNIELLKNVVMFGSLAGSDIVIYLNKNSVETFLNNYNGG